LPGAIESVKLGCSERAEIIVIDDASTDATPEVCAEIPGISYHRMENNVGLAGARNAGIEISTGEYLAFLDDDDRRLPGSFDLQIRTLETAPDAALVYGPVIWGDSETCEPIGILDPPECPSGDVFWRLLEGNFIHVPSVVVRKSLVEEAGRFDKTVPGVEDWMLWLSLTARYRVVAVSTPVAIYRQYNQQSNQISSNRARMCRISARVQAKALDFQKALAAPPALRRRIRRRFLAQTAGMLLVEAGDAVAGSRYRLALDNMFAALCLNPRGILRPNSLRVLRDALQARKAGTLPGKSRLRTKDVQETGQNTSSFTR
jgi:hypothetical protein